MVKKSLRKAIFDVKVARIFLLIQFPLMLYVILVFSKPPDALHVAIALISALIFSATGLKLVLNSNVSQKSLTLLVVPYILSILFVVAFGLKILTPLFIAMPFIGYLSVLLGGITIQLIVAGGALTLLWGAGALLSLLALLSLFEKTSSIVQQKSAVAPKVKKKALSTKDKVLAIIILSIGIGLLFTAAILPFFLVSSPEQYPKCVALDVAGRPGESGDKYMTRYLVGSGSVITFAVICIVAGVGRLRRTLSTLYFLKWVALLLLALFLASLLHAYATVSFKAVTCSNYDFRFNTSYEERRDQRLRRN